MIFLYGIALLAGIATAVQPGQSTQLARSFGGEPFAAGLVSMLVGTVTMLAVGLVTGRLHLPGLQQVAGTPWWAWGGGVLGAGVILSQLFVAQRIGAATFLGLLVTAGVVTSITLDHFGLEGFATHPASLARLVGGGLMIVGVALVALF
ncbi:DMT family transporter [Methylobacterium sp. DB1607]|nr:DMT family transporter [Methylobacterium sp. DB1607]